MSDIEPSTIIASTGRILSVEVPITRNARLSIRTHGHGVSESAAGRLQIRAGVTAGGRLSIIAPSIQPVTNAYGAHAGQGVVLLTWLHPDHERVLRYDIYASDSPVVNYELVSSVDAKRATIRGMPMGANIYFRVVSIGKNGAVSDYCQVIQGKAEKPQVTMNVTGIAGSTIPSGSIFTSFEDESNSFIVISAAGVITL